MDYREYYDQRSRARRRSRRLRFKPRFFAVVAALFLIAVVLMIALLGNQKGYVVGYGAYKTNDEAYDAIVIRDEMSYRADSYSMVDYAVQQGQDVNTGDSVMLVYASGYIDSLMSQLDSVRDQITAEQEESILSKIIDPQLNELNAQIDDCVAGFSRLAQGGAVNAAQKEYELSALLSQRQTYLKSSAVAMTNSTLSDLYSQETLLLGRIQDWCTTYAAPKPGRVSFYFDDLETVLIVSNVPNLLAEHLRRLVAGERPELDKTILAQEPLFRLVNPNLWYVVATIPQKSFATPEGQSVPISISGYDAGPVTATVRQAKADEKTKTVLVVFELTQDIGSLLDKRYTTVKMGVATEGLMIPLSALKTVEGQQGVYLKETGAFVPVTVLVGDGKHALVRPVQEGALQKGSVIAQ